ncbi:hypothetical protein MY10362_007290 [Beauveria mimosiformis]
MLPATVLALCTVAMAAPMPNPQRLVPLIDINANNNKLDFPINVLGLQTHDVSAANGNLSPGQASAPAAAASPAPAAQAPATTTTNTDSPDGKGANGNTLNFPINVLGAQTHDISAFNGNLSPNRGPAAAAAPAPPQAANAQGAPAPAAAPQAANVQGVPVAAVAPPQAANAQGALNNASYVIPTTATTVAAVAAPQNGLMGPLSGMTSALYALAGAITGTMGGQA